jgi:uncharacterized protein YjbI with pentapeptide repeats
LGQTRTNATSYRTRRDHDNRGIIHISGGPSFDPYPVDLHGTCLGQAALTGPEFTYVVLTNAYLVGADLSGTNLMDANLRGANLRNANLRGADLRSAEYDPTTDATGAQTDDYTLGKWW